MNNHQPTNKPMTVWIIGAVLLLIIVAAVGFLLMQNTAEEPAATQSQSKAPVNPRYTGTNFSIQPPLGWQEKTIQGALVAFEDDLDYYPEENPAHDINFMTYCAVTFDNDQGLSFSEIIDYIKNETISAIPTAHFTTETADTIDGYSAAYLEAGMLQQDINFLVHITLVDIADKYYMISCNTTKEKWEDYRDIFYEFAQSFQYGAETADVNVNTATQPTNSTVAGTEARYEISADPVPGTKHFMLDVVDGTINYDTITVSAGDSFRITLMEEGRPVEFTFPSTGQTSQNGTFTTTVGKDATDDTVSMTCLNKNCGELTLIIKSAQ